MTKKKWKNRKNSIKLYFSFIEPDPWKIAYTLDGKGVRSMKKEELFETMGNLDPGMVEKAGKYHNVINFSKEL